MKITVLSILFTLTCLLSTNVAYSHDTWVQSGPLVTRVGDVVHVDLMLGNHGNQHRDFKLASKVTLAPCTLAIITPAGTEIDLKEKIVDVGYGPKEGFWSAPFLAEQPGLYQAIHTLDTLHGTTRAIKTGKTLFYASSSFDVSSPSQSDSLPIAGKGLEFLLKTPLEQLAAGSELRLQLIHRGKPVDDTVVSFIPRGAKLNEGFDEKYERRTNESGEVSFTPSDANLLLAVAHLPSPSESGEGYDKTHYSATYVLPIPKLPYSK